TSLAVMPAILYAASAALYPTLSPFLKSGLAAILTASDAAPMPRIQTGFLDKLFALSLLARMMQELPSALAQQSPWRRGWATRVCIFASGFDASKSLAANFLRYTALSLTVPYEDDLSLTFMRSSWVRPWAAM